MLKVTSGGIVRGARPMWELYCEVEEKGRWLWWKAGRRNEGRVVEGLGTAIGRMRALESIVLVWSTMRQGWIFCEVVMIF